MHRMNRWCALQQALGLESLDASTSRACAQFAANHPNFTLESGSALPPDHAYVLDGAAEREKQRHSLGLHGCGGRVCQLRFVGKCERSPRMYGTHERPKILQFDIPGLNRRLSSRAEQRTQMRMQCALRANAWRKTCGPGTQVAASLQAPGAEQCAIAARSSGGVHVISQPSVKDAFRAAQSPEGYPVYKPARCERQTAQRIPKTLWQTGRGRDRLTHNNASASSARLAAALIGMDVVQHWHNDREAREFVASACPSALYAYDCLRPHAYKADLWRYCVMYARGGMYLDAVRCRWRAKLDYRQLCMHLRTPSHYLRTPSSAPLRTRDGVTLACQVVTRCTAGHCPLHFA